MGLENLSLWQNLYSSLSQKCIAKEKKLKIIIFLNPDQQQNDGLYHLLYS